jgi:hypothetical protein
MQSLYNSNSLSDVGCTFRLLRRSAVEQMLPDFRVRSNFFGPEMMLLTKWKGLRFIQIPVNYRTRIGESSVTGSHRRAFLLGLQMIWLILTFWMRGYPRR